MNTHLYKYACNAREAMQQHAAKARATLTPEQLEERRLAARRLARLAGRPVVPEKAQT